MYFTSQLFVLIDTETYKIKGLPVYSVCSTRIKRDSNEVSKTENDKIFA